MRFKSLLSVAVIGCLSSVVSAQEQPIPAPADQPLELPGAAGPGARTVRIRPGGKMTGELRLSLPNGHDVLLIRDEQHEKGAYLGVSTSPPAQAVRKQLKLSTGTALGVDFVEKGSPADKAGMKQYDVITKLDDQILIDAHQLAVLVRMHKPGDEVTLSVIREGKSETLKAKLVEHDLPPLDVLGNFGVEFFDEMMPPPPGMLPPGGQREVRPLPGPQKFQLRLHPGEGAMSTTTWADGEHTLTVTSTPGSKEKMLVATDRNGTVLFKGPIDTAEQRAKVPTIVADKLKKLEAATTVPPKAGKPDQKKGDAGKDDTETDEGAKEVEIQIKS